MSVGTTFSCDLVIEALARLAPVSPWGDGGPAMR